MPEFLEPQKFSLVKLFCPILLIKFYFISPQAQLTQIISTLPQKSPQIWCPAPNMRPSRNSPKFHSLSTSPQTHTITHPPIEVTKILSDSHILILEKPCRICTYSTGFERSSRLLEFLGKFIVGFAHYKNFSGRICTLPKIVGFAHIRPHVTPVEQCRICTKAQGNCPALNTNDNKNHSHLKSGMRMIIIRI